MRRRSEAGVDKAWTSTFRPPFPSTAVPTIHDFADAVESSLLSRRVDVHTPHGPRLDARTSARRLDVVRCSVVAPRRRWPPSAASRCDAALARRLITSWHLFAFRRRPGRMKAFRVQACDTVRERLRRSRSPSTSVCSASISRHQAMPPSRRRQQSLSLLACAATAATGSDR
jgi:hypothetical protein